MRLTLPTRSPAPLVLVFTLAGALFALSGGLYHHVRSSEAEHLRVVCNAQALGTSEEVRTRYAHIHDALRRLADRGYTDHPQGEGGRGVKAWAADARFYVDTFVGLRRIVWVGADFTVGASVPDDAPPAIGASAGEIDAQAGEEIVWFPSYDATRLLGYVVGFIDVAEVFDAAWNEPAADFAVQVDGDADTGEVYRSQGWADARRDFATSTVISRSGSAPLRVSVAPTRQTVRLHLAEARWALAAALSLSAIVVAVVVAARGFRLRAIRSEGRYRNLFDASRDGIFVINRHGEYLDANPAACALVGYSAQELREMTTRNLLSPNDPDAHSTDPPKEWREGGIVEVLLRHKDGHDVPVELVVSPIFEHSSHEFPSRIVGIARDMTERKRSEESLRAALARSDSLIRELYHRTKNNLQVIMSILDLESGDLTEPCLRRAFVGTRNRVYSMALVHDTLYDEGDLSSLRLDDYVRMLADSIITSSDAAGRVALRFATTPTTVLIDTAFPCGLALTEILSNAISHGYPESRAGEIMVTVRRDPSGEVVLSVADDGVGVGPGVDLHAGASLGLRLVALLVEQQLGGSVSYESDGGVRVTVRFRDDQYRQRV